MIISLVNAHTWGRFIESLLIDTITVFFLLSMNEWHLSLCTCQVAVIESSATNHLECWLNSRLFGDFGLFGRLNDIFQYPRNDRVPRALFGLLQDDIIGRIRWAKISTERLNWLDSEKRAANMSKHKSVAKTKHKKWLVPRNSRLITTTWELAFKSSLGPKFLLGSNSP